MYHKSKSGEIVDLSKKEGFQYKMQNYNWNSLINKQNILYLILAILFLYLLYLIFKKK
jgi:hypothetical protein